MEVHPPHSPIHTFKDFFIHLLAITIGLLIALGLEAAVEAVHHHQEVREARETIEAEIAANRRELGTVIPQLKEQAQTLEAMREIVGAPHPAAPKALRLNVSVASLRRASYETSQISGALALMDYEEASAYAETYQLQTIFNNVQDHAVLDTEMKLVGALPGPSASVLEGAGKLSAPELAILRQKINDYRGQLIIYRLAADELDKQYAKGTTH